MSETKYYLNANVFNNCTGGVHAMTGAEVKILSRIEEHTQVVNVEDRYGNRFPVSLEKLSTEPIRFEQLSLLLRQSEIINHYKESFLYH